MLQSPVELIKSCSGATGVAFSDENTAVQGGERVLYLQRPLRGEQDRRQLRQKGNDQRFLVLEKPMRCLEIHADCTPEKIVEASSLIKH